MTKKTHLAFSLMLLMGVLTQAGAQASGDKSVTPQKPASKEPAEKSGKEQAAGDQEKRESLGENEMNFPEPQGPVELRASRGTRINLKLADSSRNVYEAIGQQAKVTVLFDPDYIPRNISVDLNGVSLLDALKLVAFETRTFWRPVTSDAIFVAQDTQAKRREFEPQVVRTYYFPNVTSPTELQDVVNTFRTIVEVQRIQQQPFYQTVTIKATPGQLAIIDKLVNDMTQAKQKTGGEYRLEYKVSESAEDNEDKKVAFKTYTLLIEPHQTGKLRIGSKVPIDAGENKKTYTDVGKNIDCTVVTETERTVSLRLTVESSGIVANEHGVPQLSSGNPVIQGTRIETNVTLELGTPTVVSSFQDPASGHHFQIEAMATRTKSRE
jgi:hypothetical protein